MNKRVLDGTGLWRSDKIGRMQPEWMRAEYANWIPMALANGVFETGTRRIWATVYSCNRPDISVEDVEEIKREMCRVGLLFLWPDESSGKVWGYFTGIEKTGRLPSPSRLKKKHEPIGPKPPAEALQSYIEITRLRSLDADLVGQWLANGCLGFGSGLGIGKGFGVGSGTGESQPPPALGVCDSNPSVSVHEDRDAAFELFWQKWPRKQNKSAARKAWEQIPISEHPSVLAGLERWQKSDQWARGVIPHSGTWLNGKRWKDEDVPQGGTNGRSTKPGFDPIATARAFGLDKAEFSN